MLESAATPIMTTNIATSALSCLVIMFFLRAARGRECGVFHGCRGRTVLDRLDCRQAIIFVVVAFPRISELSAIAGIQRPPILLLDVLIDLKLHGALSSFLVVPRISGHRF